MARRSREDTARTRQQVLDAAAALFRARGVHGVSITEVMAAAGLTHGGFYKHFSSKEELCAAAIEHASRGTAAELRKRMTAPGAAAFAKAYLSKLHRASPDKGCVVAALAGDAVHAAPEPRAAFGDAVRELAALIQDQLGPARPAVRRRALANLATAVGAMILSRAVADGALSDELLEAAAAQMSE
jgi:TetR/AcrR family transcriptional regulator, transcriptional repressor for nem operon